MSSSPTSSTSTPVPPLPAKVQQWLQFVEKQLSDSATTPASKNAIISISQAVDLTTNPSTVRASFPHPLLPPLRHISYEDLVTKFLGLPSIGFTAFGSFLSGAIFALGYLAMNGRIRTATSILMNPGASSAASVASLTRPLKAIISLVASFLLLKWLSTRYPKRQKLSSSFDVSSHADGPCVVTGPVVTITNSHAGTHADTPAHFVRCCGSEKQEEEGEECSNNKKYEFHKSCYAGDCVIIDISESLASRGNKEIDEAVLIDAVSRQQQQSSSFDWENVWRIIICSKRLDSDRDMNDAWKNDFAHFTPAGANFLALKCPKLMMIGTDSPSVDRSDASPLIRNSHGVFWNHRIAIVENINCAPLYERLVSPSVSGVLEGQVQCVFNEAQKFEDAEGCNVLFYPRRAADL